MDEDRVVQLRSLMAAKHGEVNAEAGADQDHARDLVEEQVDAEWGPIDWDRPVGSGNAPQLSKKVHKGNLPAPAIPFPGCMKRGPKVRKGPCAEVIQFPAPLGPDDLRAEWSWLKNNYRDWDNEETTGRDDEKDWKKSFYMQVGFASAGGKPLPTKVSIRSQVAEWRAVIGKRTRVKDWLESLGVNWDNVDTPEQALFFLFDRMHERKPPSVA